MKEFHKYFAATFLSCAMFCTGASAMQISQWDGLSDSQKNDFTIVLISGAIDNLKTNNHADKVPVLMDLFFNNNPSIATGKQEFYNNIGAAKQINTTLQPSAQTIQVEGAFRAALKDHGIDIPLQDLLAIGKTYQVPTATSGSQH